jgi:hypothetical protein
MSAAAESVSSSSATGRWSRAETKSRRDGVAAEDNRQGDGNLTVTPSNRPRAVAGSTSWRRLRLARSPQEKATRESLRTHAVQPFATPHLIRPSAHWVSPLGLSGVSCGPRAQWVRVPNATTLLRPTRPSESHRRWDALVAAVIGTYRAFPIFPARRGLLEKNPPERFQKSAFSRGVSVTCLLPPEKFSNPSGKPQCSCGPIALYACPPTRRKNKEFAQTGVIDRFSKSFKLLDVVLRRPREASRTFAKNVRLADTLDTRLRRPPGPAAP